MRQRDLFSSGGQSVSELQRFRLLLLATRGSAVPMMDEVVRNMRDSHIPHNFIHQASVADAEHASQNGDQTHTEAGNEMKLLCQNVL